jgi:mannose-6-phosphate isomerase-like protein (cupin superfamily)
VPAVTLESTKQAAERKEEAMEAQDRVRHVAPGVGRSLWVAGDLVTFKVVGEDTGGAFVLGEDVTPPGGGPPPHVHRREDEVFCVVEGEYEFSVGERTIRAGAGSVVYGPRNVPHSFRNVGTTPARMLAFVAPAGIEDFFKEVGEEATDVSTAPPFGQEEIERLLAAAPRYGIEMLPPPETGPSDTSGRGRPDPAGDHGEPHRPIRGEDRRDANEHRT